MKEHINNPFVHAEEYLISDSAYLQEKTCDYATEKKLS